MESFQILAPLIQVWQGGSGMAGGGIDAGDGHGRDRPLSPRVFGIHHPLHIGRKAAEKGPR